MTPPLVVATTLYPPGLGGPATYLPPFVAHAAARTTVRVVAPAGSIPQPSRGVEYRFYRRIYRRKRIDVLVNEARLARSLAESARGARVLYMHGCGLAHALLVQTRRRISAGLVACKFTGYQPWEHYVARTGSAISLDEFVALEGSRLMQRTDAVARVMDGLHRDSLAACGLVVTPGNYLATVLERLGVPAGRIRVIPNPVRGHADFAPSGRDDGNLRLVTASRLVAHKGLEELIAWVARRPELDLTIAGDGPDREKLERRLASDGIANVHLVGQLAAPALHELIARSDRFVLNSRYEGFSHVLAECAVVGTPFVATRIPGNEDVLHVVGPMSGRLFEPGDGPAFEAALRASGTHRGSESEESARRRTVAERLSAERLYDETLESLGL